MAKLVVSVLGAVFVLIGILGFIEPLTPDDKVLGLFAVNGLHNVIHLLSGVVALIAASSEATARLYGKVFGVVYALVTVLGFLMVGDGSILGLIPINQADNVLHIFLTVVLLYVGFGTEGESRGRTRSAA